MSGEDKRLLDLSRKTGRLVWIVVLLVPVVFAMFAAQPASLLLDSPWIRSLRVQPSELSFGFRTAFFLGHLAAYSPLLWALVKLGSVAQAYARGEIFEHQRARALSSAAWALILVPLILPVTVLLSSVLLVKLGFIASGRMAVHVQVEWFLISAVGLVLRLVALAMKRAVVIAREHQEFV